MPSAFRSLAVPCLFASALSVGLALPAPARACSYGIQLVDASYPARGAVDVPTNAVLFIYGQELSAANDARLLDTMTGASIPLEMHTAPSGLDLLPLEPLLPNRTYQLLVSPIESSARAASAGDDIVEFTTGSEAVEAAPSASAPQLDATVVTYSAGSCGTLSQLCLGLAEHPGTTLEVRVGDEVLANPTGPWGWSRLYGRAIGEDECINIRLRDALGRRSPPTVICEADLRRADVKSYDSTDGVNCDNYSQLIEPAQGDDVSQPPDYVSPPEPGTLPEPQRGYGKDIPSASDSSLTSSGSRASSGCAMASGSGGGGLAGLGLALSAYVVARRRSRR